MNTTQAPKKTLHQKKTFQVISSVFSLIALITLSYLTSHYFQVHSGSVGFGSSCNINASFNCDAVALSPYAKLFGLPLSAFGAGTALTLFLLSLLSLGRKKSNILALRAVGVFSVIVSMIYLGIIFFVIKVGCLYCLIANLSFLASTISSFFIKPDDQTLENSEFDVFQLKTPAILFLTSMGFVLLMTLSLKPKPLPEYLKNASVQKFLDAPSKEIPKTDLVLGNPDGKITIVKFSDFQCPSCKYGAHQIHKLMTEFPDLRVELRNYPLDSNCNGKIQGQLHPFACLAAYTAVCLAQKVELEKIYTEIFQNQEIIDAPFLRSLALKFDVEEAWLNACVESTETKNKVKSDLELGNTLDVQGTPSFFINGKKIESIPFELWPDLIRTIQSK